MNVKRLTPPLLMALAVSSVCTLALSRKIAHGAAPIATVGYVVPVHAFAAGDVLKADGVQLAQWPGNRPVQGAFLKTADVVGRALLYPVDANQPLTDKLLSAPGAGPGLAARIPEGMRAIALKTDEVMGVAGCLTPGAHIDVLVTYRTDKVPDPRTVTVLQNAEVLAAGQQVQPDPQGKPSTVSVVTLLLAPQDAERAVLASSQGTIHFVMRSGADQGKTRASRTTRGWAWRSWLTQTRPCRWRLRPRRWLLPPSLQRRPPRPSCSGSPPWRSLAVTSRARQPLRTEPDDPATTQTHTQRLALVAAVRHRPWPGKTRDR